MIVTGIAMKAHNLKWRATNKAYFHRDTFHVEVYIIPKMYISIFTMILSTSGAQALPGAKPGVVTCEVEQIVLFADRPADYPDGPAFLGSQLGIGSNVDESSEKSMEQILQDTVNNFVKELRGAKFKVDLETGMLKSIPFGEKKLW